MQTPITEARASPSLLLGVRKLTIVVFILTEYYECKHRKSVAFEIKGSHITRHGNKTRTRGYPPEPAANLTGKTRFDWVWVFPDYKIWGWVR